MYKRRLLTLVSTASVICLTTLMLFAQEVNYPDTIVANLKRLESATEKVTYLNESAYKLRTSEPALALALAHKAKTFSGDDQILIGNTNITLAQLLSYTGETDSAELLLKEARQIFLTANDSTQLAKSYFELGTLYYKKSKDSLSLDNFFTALSMFQALNNLRGQAFVYNNLSNLVVYMGDIEGAIDYTLKSIDLKKQLGEEALLGSSYHNLGRFYYRLDNMDLAINYFRMSVRVNKKYNNIKGLASTYNSLAGIQLKLKQNDSAIFYHQEAIAMDRQLHDMPGLANDVLSLADSYFELGDFKKAAQYSLEALTYAEEPRLIRDTRQVVAQSYQGMGDYQKALEYYQLYMSLNDSLTNADRQESIDELREKYEAEEKQKEIILLARENEIAGLELDKTRSQLYLALAAVVLVVGGAFVFIWNTQLKRKLLNEEITNLRNQLNLLLAPGDSQEDLSIEAVNSKLTAPLTEREFEILRLAVSDMNNKEIAETVFLSVHTVKFHLSKIYEKLGVNDRQAALKFIATK
jgi:DNA-binding CsgD family transcriptional regulator